MKHFYSGMLVMLALMLAVVMGVVALAESAEPEVPLPPAAEEAPAADAPAAEAPAADAATDSTALQDALKAYDAARQSSQVESLEAELKGYVDSGKLTQDQADLILNYYREQESLRNGTCPNCGYQFQTNGGFGRGGHGGRGGRGGRGGMRGMSGMNQLPGDAQDGAETNAFTFDDAWQVMPDASQVEGI